MYCIAVAQCFRERRLHFRHRLAEPPIPLTLRVRLVQSTSPTRFDASKRYEPYASLEQRDLALPCTIDRREGLTRAKFEAEFMQKKPVVLVGGSGLLERGGAGKHHADVRLTPGALGTAQVEIPKLLTETYAQSIVRTGRPEELPRGLVRHTEPLVEFLRRPYTEDNVSGGQCPPLTRAHASAS